MPMFEGEKEILPIMKVVWSCLILLNIPGRQTPVDLELVIIYSCAFHSVGVRELLRDEVSELMASTSPC